MLVSEASVKRRSRYSVSQKTYVYECPMCRKRFRRKTMNGALNPHKRPDGWNCGGRMGYLVDTQY
jgi:predicted SprT family Zn-dependent metalloprotease